MAADVKNIGDELVTIDRRNNADRREKQGTEANDNPRRKQQRRRHIDPTTCEREYNTEEIDFMRAMDAYKRSSGRMFPTCSEVLEVIRALGYVRLTEDQREILAESELDTDDELATTQA